jgi:crotonobetainyl-CoA:carnitine CoA-transferase CaiB-like acyl-CoA transferase
VREVQPGVPVPAAPWRSDGATIGVAGPAVAAGTHNDAVLADLGYRADEVARLRADGALRGE